MTVTVVRGDARCLPLADASVDLIVTSPPYFALRSYTDAGEHYAGQIGSEASPADYIAALVECTREWVRVLKPSGSIFVNLGDSYAGTGKPYTGSPLATDLGTKLIGRKDSSGTNVNQRRSGAVPGIRPKSLMLLPERYRIACVDELGLIARAVIVWSKPNGLPESVTDRVRRSHEDWVHLTRRPRYFSAVDEIREPHLFPNQTRTKGSSMNGGLASGGPATRVDTATACNPLGKLPGSVWEMPEVESVLRLILRAVASGEISPEEGERLWTSGSDSYGTLIALATAGSGQDGATLAATARRPSSVSAERIGHTESPTGSLSATSPTGSPSTTSAATPHASGPTTSSLSPGPRTSAGHSPNGTSAPSGTLSPMPTSNGPAPAPSESDAGLATWGEYESGRVETVWTVPTEPLIVPLELGIDHFAAYPSELPRRLILGWSPSGICCVCGEGRRPDVERKRAVGMDVSGAIWSRNGRHSNITGRQHSERSEHTIVGEACACPEPSAPTRRAVVLDPFGGTGTTALVADVLGRDGISVDMSADYCRLAAWRTTDPCERARAMRVSKPDPVHEDQLALWDGGR